MDDNEADRNNNTTNDGAAVDNDRAAQYDLRGSTGVQVGENPKQYVNNFYSAQPSPALLLLRWVGRTARKVISRVRLRRRRVLAVAAAIVVLVLVVLAVVVALGTDDTPSDAQLARVPASLRANCHITDSATGYARASAVLTCSTASQSVQISLFDQQSTMDSAYADAIHQSGVSRSTDDCTITTGAEHRYPSTGIDPTGRVLCYSQDSETNFVWTNDHALTIARASRRSTDDLGLEPLWASWVGLPAYPTNDEQMLVNMVDLQHCRRALAGNLDAYRDLLAAIECDSSGQGADTVSYYKFANLDALARAHDHDVANVHAPLGVYCGDGTAPGFVGDQRLDLRGADIGDLLCYRDQHNTPVIEWTFDPLLVTGRATGADPTPLASWWRGYFGYSPPTAQLVAAANAEAKPSFPTGQEKALLNHIPQSSRVNCMRPSQHQIETNIGQAKATAIVCGPTRGASIVFYYQFNDAASMNAAYARNNDISLTDCTTQPTDFHGNAPYSRNGTSGQLGCGKNSNGPYLIWTNDQLEIATMVFGGADPAILLDWWRSDAGPM
jgi:hypothetical protein